MMRRIATLLRQLAVPLVLAAVELALAGVVVAGIAQPVLAQGGWFPFFNNGNGPRRPFFQQQPQWHQPQWQQQQQPQWQWWPQQQQSPQRREVVDFSKAPPPRKPETQPTTQVAVMGDSMADWLAYGLEDAFGETPEIGVLRKNRANRGLILGTSKNEYDWAAVAREILAAEKIDFVVMMIGLADRQSIHVRVAPTKPGQKQPPQKPEAAKADQLSPQADKTDPASAELQDAPAAEESTQSRAPEPGTSTASTYEFRSEKWEEAYAKRVDEVIAALKSKGVPVFWVGLPAIRGNHATSDMVYLNEIYRGRAEKAGVIYVDVWDGFVDENGTYAPRGPDFEGQIRQLRTGDGVYFTKPGARKLAHYVEREIRRVMQAHGVPIAMPSPEEPQPQAPSIKPGTPIARPVAGPVVSLTANPSGGSETLLGGGPARAPSGDSLATRVMVKGEPVQSLRGRADDFAWPRQEGMPVASMGVAGPETPVQASITTTAPATAEPSATTIAPPPDIAAPATANAAPAAPPKPKRPVAPKPPQSLLPPLFGSQSGGQPGSQPPRPSAPINRNSNNGNGQSAFWPWSR
jgi:hypothetical protein